VFVGVAVGAGVDVAKPSAGDWTELAFSASALRSLLSYLTGRPNIGLLANIRGRYQGGNPSYVDKYRTPDDVL